MYTYKQYTSTCVCTLKYSHILLKHAPVISLLRGGDLLVPKQLDVAKTDGEKKTTRRFLISRLGELQL